MPSFRIVCGTAVSVLAYLSVAPAAYAAPAPTFSAAVQAGMKQQAAQGAQVSSDVASEDYTSAWDEFGSNAIVNGTEPEPAVTAGIASDISSDVERSISYNEEEMLYLKKRNTSPGEVQAAEGDQGGDILPQDSIDPNPSLEANPSVTMSAVQDLGVTETVLEAESADTATPDAPTSNAVPPPENGWTPDDTAVFEAVIDDIVPPADDTSSSANEESNAPAHDASGPATPDVPAVPDQSAPADVPSSADAPSSAN